MKLTEEQIIENNKLIAEFMRFERYFPNMASESELSKMYYYPYRNHIFYEGLYIHNMKQTSAEGTYVLQSIADCNHLKDLHFHKSFDWLMPVVEKIEHLEEDQHTLSRFDINSHHARFWPLTRKEGAFIAGCYETSPEVIKFKTKIEAVYYVVVESIKCYNLIKK